MPNPPTAQDESSNPPEASGLTSCVLGVDVGTSSVKAVLLHKTEQGPAVIASCSRDTKAQVESRTAGPQGNEQDVHKIMVALNDCLANLPQKLLEKVCRIHVSGQMHGVMFWKVGQGCKWTEDRSGWTFGPAGVSPLVTWQDGRCSSRFLSLLPAPQSHLGVATGFGCATIFWFLKNSPDFLKPYDAAGTIQDYMVAMLCGQNKPRMSEQNAASWGYFNTVQKSWNVDMKWSLRAPWWAV